MRISSMVVFASVVGLTIAVAAFAPILADSPKKSLVTCNDGQECGVREGSLTVHRLYVYLDYDNKVAYAYCDSNRTVEAKYVWVRPGDVVTWEILNPESPKARHTLEFDAKSDAFGLEDRNGKVQLRGKKRARMCVQDYAVPCKNDPTNGTVDFRITGFKGHSPGPGIIVCPPTGPCS